VPAPVLLQVGQGVNKGLDQGHHLGLWEMFGGAVAALDDLGQTDALFLPPLGGHPLCPSELRVADPLYILMLRQKHRGCLAGGCGAGAKRRIVIDFRSYGTLFLGLLFRGVSRGLVVLMKHSIGVVGSDLPAFFFGIVLAVELLLSHYQYYKLTQSHLVLVLLKLFLRHYRLPIRQHTHKVFIGQLTKIPLLDYLECLAL
jgi:hypothetical protein